MKTKAIIVGIFVKKNKVLSMLDMLKNKFKVNLAKIYIYSIENNEREYLISFKAYDKDKFIGKISNSTVMHVKNGSLFSINALNRLIEEEALIKNIPNNEYLIDWNRYKNKLIILTKGKLSISNLNKIEDTSLFFK
jgi:hypothetical protein